MDPERFDDVEFHILEEPEEPRRPRLSRRARRWALAAGASVVVAGGLAAGASALTGSNEAKTPAARERALSDHGGFHRNGHVCHRHDRSGAGSAYAPAGGGSY